MRATTLCLGILSGCLCGLGIGHSAAADDTSSAVAEAALKPLRERAQKAQSADFDQLKRELLAYRRTFPGTPQALEAMQLLGTLPSPLDKLDPKNIPALDRFDWQPAELVAVLGEHRGRHGGQVHAVAYSPDGKWVASGGSNYAVRLWDPTTLRQKAYLGHGGHVYSLAFDRESKRLVAGGTDGNARIWDITVDPPKLLTTFHVGSLPVYSVAFHPDGKTLACGCGDSQAQIWEIIVPTPKEQQPTILQGHNRAVRSVLYANRGLSLITGGADGTFCIWDLTGNKVRQQSSTETKRPDITAMALSPDGQTLATGHSNGTFVLWNIFGSRPKEKETVKAHAGAVNTLVFSGTGRTVATGGADTKIKFWDVSKPEASERLTLEGHIDPVSAIAYAPNGLSLVSGSHDWTVRMWNLPTTPGGKGSERYPPKGHLSHVYSVALPLNGITLASGSYDRSTLVWNVDAAAPKQRHLLRGEAGHVYSLTYGLDSKTLAVGGQLPTVWVWDALSGQTLKKLPGAATHVTQLQLTPDGWLLLGVSGREVVVWEVEAGLPKRRLEGHLDPIHSLSLSPDGKRALTGGGTYKYDDKGKIIIADGKPVYNDTSLRLWDVDAGKELDQSKAHTTPIGLTLFLPDRRAVSESADTGLKMWQRPDDLLVPLPLPWKLPLSRAGLLPSPDGRLLLTWLGGALVVVDPSNGVQKMKWTFAESVGSVAFSACSHYVVIGLQTGPVYVLRLANREN